MATAGRGKSGGRTGRKTANKTANSLPVGWTPQMQFSKRIARTVMVVWIVFVGVVLAMLVVWREVDAMMALTGWVTSVMITMVGAYTGNSMYEKHLDKGMASGFYRYGRGKPEDEENGDPEIDSGDGEIPESDCEMDGETDSVG